MAEGYQVLYRKYRPRDFSQVVGQESVVLPLVNAVKSGRIAHAYLFSGPRGVGKTTVARILARSVNDSTDDSDVDLIEIDAASNRGIEEIRELREAVRFAPARGKYKIYIIDEVHMLTKEAFNALLKTLEEPPAHIIFILATTEVEKLPPTVVSRTQHYEFRRPSMESIAEKLVRIAKAEKVSLEKEAAQVIALASEGSLRDAEGILGQVMAVEDAKITVIEVEETLGLPRREAVWGLYKAFLHKNIKGALEIIQKSAAGGRDPGQFLKALVRLSRLGIFAKLDHRLVEEGECLPEEKEMLAEVTRQVELTHLKKILSVLTDISQSIRHAPIPELPLELAALEIAAEDK